VKVMVRIVRDRRVLLSVAVIGSLIAVALWPRAVVADLGVVSRGRLVVTIDEEGRTRFRHRFVVSAPVSGRLLRIELDPGDRVRQGDVVARMQPESPALLDARARAEAMAAVQGAEAALGRARAYERRARATLTHVQRELSRERHLATAGATSPQALEAREAEAALASEAVSAAQFAVHAADAELVRAKARLGGPTRAGEHAPIAVKAPVDGVVLRRVRESEAIVPAGEALIEIGDPHQLEVVADLLTTDAVRVKPGARASVEQWGGETLEAVVRRIEPGGFTKVSALGVEEQRVNVVLDFTDPEQACALLGDAYRVEARIVLWEAPDVLKVPTAAMFRANGQWAIYVLHDGRARLTAVDIGHLTAQESELKSGPPENAVVIVHPGDLVRDGVRIVTPPAR
jgi:HlyD family secretion protein